MTGWLSRIFGHHDRTVPDDQPEVPASNDRDDDLEAARRDAHAAVHKAREAIQITWFERALLNPQNDRKRGTHP